MPDIPARRFQRGDHVYVGEPDWDKVHWEVVSVSADGLRVGLRSPMSSRGRLEDAANLTLHTPIDPTPSHEESA